MHTAAMYREMAEECFKWAATAVTDEARATYLSIAQIWLQAARLDGGLPIRGARLPDPPAGTGKLSVSVGTFCRPSNLMTCLRSDGTRPLH
jgi:hypothetical protein